MATYQIKLKAFIQNKADGAPQDLDLRTLVLEVDSNSTDMDAVAAEASRKLTLLLSK